jgi:hypothetical protein
MSSECQEEVRAFSKSLHKWKPFNAAATSFAISRIVKSDDECRSMPSSGNTGSDDSDDSLMPVTLS